MSCFISRLYFPPQCDRAKKVHPISTSLACALYPWNRDDPMILPSLQSIAVNAPREASDSLKNSLNTWG